ncbi:hypothetical protein Ae717Ps2_6662c [Pseudonocardia sp. Ae717_Ps2]|nr:hypothetical protein Ae717Ps2_6662c [Pseudonocardia sp. Ae717_Ps2]
MKVTDATGTSAEATTGANGRIAGFSGLWTCGMVWMCPECSVRIGAKRAEEVATVLAHHLAEGGDPLLITLTMRHHRQHSLAECLKALTVAWGEGHPGPGRSGRLPDAGAARLGPGPGDHSLCG